MLIACLDFQNFNDGAFKYKGLSDIAHELGHHVETIAHDGTSDGILAAYERAGELIRDANAFFIPRAQILRNNVLSHPAHASQLHKRVRSGARLVVTPYFDSPALDSWNWFLAPYDVAVTTLRIHRSIFKAADVNTTEITIKRSAHSFRDPRLFQGVDDVVLNSPVAIWYGGESLPVLCATENEMPVDGTTDFLPMPETGLDPSTGLPPEWNGRELACMAMWRGQNENDGAVLASIGPGFGDPFIERNQRLAKNVVHFLCERPQLSVEQRLHNRFERIERNLIDFVLAVVRTTGPNWWTDCIPEKIRLRCDEMQRMRKVPKEACFNIIDFKEIMEKQWTRLFESHLSAEGCGGGKRKALSWCGRLSDLRNLVMHPSKIYITGYTFSKAEEDFVADCDDLVLRLVRRVKPVT